MIDIKVPPVILDLFVSISLYHTFFCPSNLGRRQTSLAETLTEAQKEVLKKYDNAVSDINCILEMGIFIYAFRLGGRCAIVMLSKDE